MKYPWIQFFATDWLNDPLVSLCAPATRGILMDWLCNMHLLDRCGQITGTLEQLSRLGRCTSVQAESALQDMVATKAADVTFRSDVVTVVNRRMKREFLTRKNGAVRVKRHRCNATCNAPETAHSHKSESESESERGKGEPPAPEIPSLEQAIAMTMSAGIPPEFSKFVFEDWASRSGKDAGGVIVKFLPYVTKRWAREQNEWKNKTHKGTKTNADTTKNPKHRNYGITQDVAKQSADIVAAIKRRESAEKLRRDGMAKETPQA